jgi:hypothetical protein
MKKTLILATLLLVPSMASAQWTDLHCTEESTSTLPDGRTVHQGRCQKVESLPTEFLGQWCYFEDRKGVMGFRRVAKNDYSCLQSNWIEMRKDGYDSHEGSCQFISTKFTYEADHKQLSVEARSDCHGGGERSWKESLDFTSLKGTLWVYRRERD